MNDIVTVGIGKGIKPALVKKASKEIGAGLHQIDELVRVQGTIKKAEDEDCAPTVSLSLLETLALTLHYAGITRESAMKAIRKAATEALEDSTTTKGELLAKYDWIADELATIKEEVIEKLPKITKQGKVTTKLTFSIVGSEQEKEAVEEEADTVMA
jgi:hypothetical protein